MVGHEDSVVANNTIVRDDNDVEGNWNTVFIIDEPPGDIRFFQNIVIVDNDQTHAIFSDGFNGAIDDVDHADNCYWNIEGGPTDLGLPTYGAGERNVDPLFMDYSGGDYTLRAESPVWGWGAIHED